MIAPHMSRRGNLPTDDLKAYALGLVYAYLKTEGLLSRLTSLKSCTRIPATLRSAMVANVMTPNPNTIVSSIAKIMS